MTDFMINYYVSQMQPLFTELNNFFKYFRAKNEKEVFDVIQKLAAGPYNANLITESIAKLKAARENFIENCEINNKKLQKLNRIGIKLKEFLKGHEEEQKEIIQSVFHLFILEYLHKNDKPQTIEFFKHVPSIYSVEKDLDLSKFILYKTILDEIQNEELVFALKWCEGNRSKLRRLKITFEYKLLVHEILAMVKRDTPMIEALEFVQNSVQLVADSTEDIYFCVRIVLEGKSFQLSREDLAWDSIVAEFSRIFFLIEGFDPNFFWENILKIGLQCLKTERCDIAKSRGLPKDGCPLCSKWSSLLALGMVPLQRQSSIVKCKLSGKILDDKNQALVMPNNNIYGSETVQKNVAKNEGMFRSRSTGKVYDSRLARKAFIA